MGYTPLLLACRYGNYQSAGYLLKRGNSQPQLRDNEFFCNARDWTLRRFVEIEGGEGDRKRERWESERERYGRERECWVFVEARQ